MDARQKWAEVRAMDVPHQLLLGPNTSDRFLMDPKRLGFYSARYTLAAKMLKPCTSILDVGCGDGLMSLTLLHDTAATRLDGIDFDRGLIDYASNILLPTWRNAHPDDSRQITFRCEDFTALDGLPKYDGVVCMDCIEHIEPSETGAFISRIHQAVSENKGIAIIGTPNKYAEHLGSPHSRTGHINTMTPADLRVAMEREFHTVLMFGMNDGTLNVGHENLWHYVVGIGCV